MGAEAAADIEKDLARTFPSLRRFASPEGQQALNRVLRAYAAYDPEVGRVFLGVVVVVGWVWLAMTHTDVLQPAVEAVLLVAAHTQPHTPVPTTAILFVLCRHCVIPATCFCPLHLYRSATARA